MNEDITVNIECPKCGINWDEPIAAEFLIGELVMRGYKVQPGLTPEEAEALAHEREVCRMRGVGKMSKMEEETAQTEPRIRLNLKVNFKGERAGELTVRGDNIEEVRGLKAEALKELEAYTKGGEPQTATSAGE